MEQPFTKKRRLAPKLAEKPMNDQVSGPISSQVVQMSFQLMSL
jgi:hypothetical protein